MSRPEGIFPLRKLTNEHRAGVVWFCDVTRLDDSARVKRHVFALLEVPQQGSRGYPGPNTGLH